MDNDDSKPITITLDDHDGSMEDWSKGNYSVTSDTPSYTYESGGTITFNASDYTTSYVTSSSTSYIDPEFEWTESKWPSEYKIEQMIEIYPALKLQYLKFIEIYNLCKDDFKTRSDDDVPF